MACGSTPCVVGTARVCGLHKHEWRTSQGVAAALLSSFGVGAAMGAASWMGWVAKRPCSIARGSVVLSCGAQWRQGRFVVAAHAVWPQTASCRSSASAQQVLLMVEGGGVLKRHGQSLSNLSVVSQCAAKTAVAVTAAAVAPAVPCASAQRAAGAGVKCSAASVLI